MLELVSLNRLFSQKVKIVSIGGGTGLARLLLGLKHFVGKNSKTSSLASKFAVSQLTALVTVTDDGGSSGRLREEFQILPPGDIRKCMVALSEDELLMSPDDIAESYWHLIQQPKSSWAFEIAVRPHTEAFFE